MKKGNGRDLDQWLQESPPGRKSFKQGKFFADVWIKEARILLAVKQPLVFYYRRERPRFPAAVKGPGVFYYRGASRQAGFGGEWSLYLVSPSHSHQS